MNTRTIGSLTVSVVGLGCNNFGTRVDAAGTTAVIDAALDAGINFLDTAELYANGESETLIGRALGTRRNEMVIATKFGHAKGHPERGGHPDNIRRAVEGSLRRLGTDVIDLYQLHSPDPLVPIADTLGALDALVQAGTVREIGCSQFSVAQLVEARAVTQPGAAHFASVQNEFSLLHREPEQGVLQECARQDIAFLPFFPLASGLLTGKYRKDRAVPAGTRITSWEDARLNAGDVDRVEALVTFAESRGHTLLELAFSWLLAHERVASVIAGATRAEQVHANATAAGWTLSAADLAELETLAAVPTGDEVIA